MRTVLSNLALRLLAAQGEKLHQSERSSKLGTLAGFLIMFELAHSGTMRKRLHWRYEKISYLTMKITIDGRNFRHVSGSFLELW